MDTLFKAFFSQILLGVKYGIPSDAILSTLIMMGAPTLEEYIDTGLSDELLVEWIVDFLLERPLPDDLRSDMFKSLSNFIDHENASEDLKDKLSCLKNGKKATEEAAPTLFENFIEEEL